MSYDKSALFDLLEVLNEDLTKKITLVAVGGTAMTLLDLKPSTRYRFHYSWQRYG